MDNRKGRREFLKRGVTVGAAVVGGGISLAGCCKHMCSKHKSVVGGDIDYSRIAYCCIKCDECPLYKATLENDNTSKMKIAKKWGDFKKPNFKIENFYCYGCKDRRSNGIPGEDCTVRECAAKKGFATCAQCGDFEACDKEFWSYPESREGVRDMKAKLGIT